MQYRGLCRGPRAAACGALWLAGLLLVLVLVDQPGRIAADLMGDIQQGLQTTGKLFGINTIADVADLVAKGFANRRGGASEPSPKPEVTEQGGGGGVGEGLLAGRTPSMMMIMMKLLGLDGNQLGAMLVNGIVFLAHIIGTNLGAFRKPALETDTSPFLRDPVQGFPKPAEETHQQSAGTDSNGKPAGGGSTPLEWLLRNPSRQLRVLLDQVQHSDLTEHLDRELRQLDHYPPEDTDCIRLLMCKIKPFIWKMQNVVRDQILRSPEPSSGAGTRHQSTTTTAVPPSGEEIMKGIHDNLPSAEEFQRQSAVCEQQFRNCTRQGTR
ncbi:uncharacterized protein LOC131294404 [Anopheles ziemanni]|uniref:uncharacterized protein LOC131265068 n=1 Tax=Anopheles coustani TaxID=139045 RepID=UPI002659F7FA|nr:uncharacterized protein LOC131265068 [Anopheles coustani]XP_058178434.1 uncharacterized protein LOC131294404 [Anopheles ziemanni]